MISSSDESKYSKSQLSSIKIGYDIHVAIIEEARRETASRTDRTKVFGYLDHDLIKSGKLPFVRYDQRTGTISRSFSREIAERIRKHIDDLRVYFDYVARCDGRSGKGTEDNESTLPQKDKGLRYELTNEN